MKKIILLSLLTTFLLSLIACTNQNMQNIDSNVLTKEDVREAVWNQLLKEDKERFDGTWEDATVSKIILNKNMMGLIDDKTYEGKEVYLIDFVLNDNSINNMIFYADVKTFALIGHGLID